MSGKKSPKGEKPAIGDWADQWEGVSQSWEITEDTEPAAIAAIQRADVLSATKQHGRDVAAISEAVCLPMWNVKRILEGMEQA